MDRERLKDERGCHLKLAWAKKCSHLCVFFHFLCCLFVSPSFADHLPAKLQKGEEPFIRVRLIQARDAVNGTAREMPQQVLDKRIEDLKQQLTSLPFTRFDTLAIRKRKASLDRVHSIALRLGHSVNLRLLYVEKGKTGLWLVWKSGEGEELLNTKLHLNCREPMVAGTELQNGEGLVLAVNVAAPGTQLHSKLKGPEKASETGKTAQ